jgi:uronate dehydrogenase
MLPSNYTYNESAAPVPDSFYGLSKAFGEAACAMYAYRFGISTLVLRIGNADPQIVDGRRERLWISARDLAQLVKLGLTAPALQYEIANAVSNCPDPLLSGDTAAAKLGYQPQDYAVDHHAPAFRSLRDLTQQDGPGLVGGRFAADPLPDPFTRLTK